jgi:hypothetical protein
VLGYDVDPGGGRLVVNEEEAERVRAIFALFEELEAPYLLVVPSSRYIGMERLRHARSGDAPPTALRSPGKDLFGFRRCP